MQIVGNVGIGRPRRCILTGRRRGERALLDIVQQSCVQRGNHGSGLPGCRGCGRIRRGAVQILAAQKIDAAIRGDHARTDHPSFIKGRQHAPDVLHGFGGGGVGIVLLVGGERLRSEAAGEGDRAERSGDGAS